MTTLELKYALKRSQICFYKIESRGWMAISMTTCRPCTVEESEIAKEIWAEFGRLNELTYVPDKKDVIKLKYLYKDMLSFDTVLNDNTVRDSNIEIDSLFEDLREDEILGLQKQYENRKLMMDLVYHKGFETEDFYKN